MTSKNEESLVDHLDKFSSKIDSGELSASEAISEANRTLNAFAVQSCIDAEEKKKEILRQAAFTFMKNHFKRTLVKFFIGVGIVLLAFLCGKISHA